MSEREDTLTDKMLRKLKNNPLVAILIILTMSITTISASLEAIKKVISTFDPPKTSSDQPKVEIKPLQEGQQKGSPHTYKNPVLPNTFPPNQPPASWCNDKYLDWQSKRDLGCPGY